MQRDASIPRSRFSGLVAVLVGFSVSLLNWGSGGGLFYGGVAVALAGISAFFLSGRRPRFRVESGVLESREALLGRPRRLELRHFSRFYYREAFNQLVLERPDGREETLNVASIGKARRNRLFEALAEQLPRRAAA